MRPHANARTIALGVVYFLLSTVLFWALIESADREAQLRGFGPAEVRE